LNLLTSTRIVIWEYPPFIMFVPADVTLLAILAKGVAVSFMNSVSPKIYIF